MHAGPKLVRALAALAPASHAGEVARRVGLAGLLTPVRGGAPVADLRFLYTSRRRNRFTPSGGPRSLYMGEDEDIGSAETKRGGAVGFVREEASRTGGGVLGAGGLSGGGPGFDGCGSARGPRDN